MKLVKRNFSREFKLQVCHEVESGLKTQAQASREYMVGSNLISQWIRQYRQDPINCFAGSGTQSKASNDSTRIKALEAALGRATLENQILKEANTLLKKIQLERSKFIRKVIGYCLSRNIDSDLVVTALKMAIKERKITNAHNQSILFLAAGLFK